MTKFMSVDVAEFNTDVVPKDEHKVKFVKVKGIEKILTSFEELNNEFAVLDLYGAPSTYVSRKDYLPITDADLGRRLANRVVVGPVTQNDGTTFIQAFDALKGNARRHTYTEIKFTNEPVTPNVFNLYKGIGVTPKSGPVDLIIKHIVEVLCGGNQKQADDFIKLQAWQIQNIGKPSRTMVLFKSKHQQVGKGLYLDFMVRLYGTSAIKPAAMEQVTGRFNDQLRGASFVFLDEVVYGGDHKAAAALKTISTTTDIGIEGKGIPVVKSKIGVNFYLASNEKNAAHIEETDERYWVFDIKIPPREGAYYSALIDQMEDGGMAAWAHYLLNLDVSKFTPWRDINKNNEAKQEMIMESTNPYDVSKWLEECATYGKIMGMKKEYNPDPDGNDIDRNDLWEDWIEGAVIRHSTLKQAYTEWQKGIRSRVAPKQAGPKEFGTALIKYGLHVRKVDRNSISVNVLPSVDSCLFLLSTGDVNTQVIDFVQKFGTDGTVEDRRIEETNFPNSVAA
jgi:hypothetical protein